MMFTTFDHLSMLLQKNNQTHCDWFFINNCNSPCDWAKLVLDWKKSILYTKSQQILCRKHIYVNKLKSGCFDMQMCILQTRTKCKGETP